MTAPIELSLFRRSIRRHTTQLCEHHLTQRPDRRKFIEFTGNVGSEKIRDLYQPKLKSDRARAVCCVALGRDWHEATDRALIADGRFRGEADRRLTWLAWVQLNVPTGDLFNAS
jgi:hypothetical protein